MVLFLSKKILKYNCYVTILKQLIMSRTFRKHVREFVACGNNTPWYRDRRRLYRRGCRHKIRNMLANHELDEFMDNISFDKLPKSDTWREPTDGHGVITKELLNWVLARRNNKNYGDYLYGDYIIEVAEIPLTGPRKRQKYKKSVSQSQSPEV